MGLKIEAFTLKGVKDIFAGRNHSFATVGEEKHLFAWGLNNNGQLGIGETGDTYLPTRVAGPLAEKSVISVVGGEHHTLALTSDGEVYGFGKNDDG